MTKTIAQQLNVKEFPFIIKNKMGKQIYCEYSKGSWHKYEYDAQGAIIYWENSKGSWVKHEYDAEGNEIYYENSLGDVVDNYPKREYTMDQIAKALNIPVNQLKIKK